MKKLIIVIIITTIVLTFAACSGQSASPAAETPATTPSENVDTEYIPVSVEYDDDDLDDSVTAEDMTAIRLEDDSVAIDGNGAILDGTTITITAAGLYSISGTLDDGQIIVDTRETGTVKLVLNGASLACSSSAPVYIISADKVVMTLAGGTDNYITDSSEYILEDAESDEPDAAVFSKCDLTINGSGSLTVEASYNNGIQSKDDLKITGGTITVNAVNNGIKGKDSIAISDGDITVNADGDGLQSNNDGDSSKGYIAISGGTFDITAGEDGIQAETNVLISGGDIVISSGGGSINSSSNTEGNWGNWGRQGGRDGMAPGGRGVNAENQGTTDTTETADTGSAKGIKAGVNITIENGTITVDSSDDSLHSNGSLTITGGTFTLASGDDGMHADATLEISGGDINITKSYEGIESAVITINGGNIDVTASDDSINVAGGADGSSINDRPGRNNFESSGNDFLYINGGYIVVDAGGDGLDCNGSIYMTGGEVIVNGPTNDGNGPLDYLGTFKITGGLIVAAGSAGMAQSPDASSTQYSVLLIFDTEQLAGTMVHIETEDGKDIMTFVPTKKYQSVVISLPELEKGTTYKVYLNGSSTGTVIDGLYSGGTYTAGTQYTTFSISSMVTTIGNKPEGGMGGPDQPGGPGGMRR